MTDYGELQDKVEALLREMFGATGSIPMRWILIAETVDGAGDSERSVHEVCSDQMALWEKMGLVELLRLGIKDEYYGSDEDDEDE